MNTRRAPERVLHTQPPDQAAHLNRNSGPAAARTRLPSPIKPKARPMPAQHSVPAGRSWWRFSAAETAATARQEAAGQRPSAWASREPVDEARSADAVSNVTSASNCACLRKGAAKTWRNSLRKSSVAATLAHPASQSSLDGIFGNHTRHASPDGVRRHAQADRP